MFDEAEFVVKKSTQNIAIEMLSLKLFACACNSLSRHTECLRRLLEPEALPCNFKSAGMCRNQIGRQQNFKLFMEAVRGTYNVPRTFS